MTPTEIFLIGVAGSLGVIWLFAAAMLLWTSRSPVSDIATFLIGAAIGALACHHLPL